ncbi:MAG: alpha-1,4-glucan--maltose-1-phosphate maltosyltransferase [Myxococcales bacterium]|nr:alpha-1,4-glucan--maltose-1-phosphate maltosyltransferase [Myxococcales bacterium]
MSPKKKPTAPDVAAVPGGSGPCPHIVIQDIRPAVDGGRRPAKRLAGEPCQVTATVFRDGHARICVSLFWRHEEERAWREEPMRCQNPGLDLWVAEITPPVPGHYLFTVEGWTDAYASWLDDFRKRVEAKQPVKSEASEGAAILERIAAAAAQKDRGRLAAAAQKLRSLAQQGEAALKLVEDEKLRSLVDRYQPREDAVRHDPPLAISAERERAAFGAWYEMFPRSQGTVPGKAATLREAERRLPDIQRMGFDVLYLPPVHPIGITHRKGRDNSLQAGPDDPGSPWAIGNASGGHDAVDPGLGTFADFDHFVSAAKKCGLEIALDIALQCSPDHPWVKEHPEWFYRRPDGSIKYAENPPKKYEDIYPLNFDSPQRESLWREIRRIFEVWITHGVSIFRVDNPHTKPLCFWEWLLSDITRAHPEVLFLAEAFTRPPMMHTLAKIGFTQSYTYFTWRNSRWELTSYLRELTEPGMMDFFRPNFFVNTPDILPLILVKGGRPAFKMRLVLAATLSPSYGIYSGFELCENQAIPHHAIPDDVEYKSSEKYEIRVRDWDAPGNIKDFIARINEIRRENPALRRLSGLAFHDTQSEDLLCYSKCTPDVANRLLMVVNLNPHRVVESMTRLDLASLGLSEAEPFAVHDLITGQRWTWRGAQNYVRLDPQQEPAHLFRIEPA